MPANWRKEQQVHEYSDRHETLCNPASCLSRSRSPVGNPSIPPYRVTPPGQKHCDAESRRKHLQVADVHAQIVREMLEPRGGAVLVDAQSVKPLSSSHRAVCRVFTSAGQRLNPKAQPVAQAPGV